MLSFIHQPPRLAGAYDDDGTVSNYGTGIGLFNGGLGASTVGSAVGTAIVMASTGLSAYHGYKRNDSIGWALVWGFLGTIAPVVTPAIAFAQGFGKRAR